MSKRTTHTIPAPAGVFIQVEPIGDGEGATIRARVGGTLYRVDLTEEVGELQGARLDDGHVCQTRLDFGGADERDLFDAEADAEVIAFPTELPGPPNTPSDIVVVPFGADLAVAS